VYQNILAYISLMFVGGEAVFSLPLPPEAVIRGKTRGIDPLPWYRAFGTGLGTDPPLAQTLDTNL
jgi:hypothetical protein